jgi:hypothetical protein
MRVSGPGNQTGGGVPPNHPGSLALAIDPFGRIKDPSRVLDMGGWKQAARSGIHRGLWAEILALALAYYGVGRLAWLLVPVPGQAVALWPSAGIALGVLLWRGLALAPGVFLGAGALAFHAILMNHSLPPGRAVVVAMALGAGGTLGPVLGTLAVRRFIDLPLRYARDILTFAALAGPAPAAISALICNGMLLWSGLLARPALALSIGVWWIGDALGALVFAPLVMMMAAAPGQLPGRRRLAVALPVFAATALAVWMFVRANDWDQQRSQAVLRQRTDAITAAVQRSLTYHLDALRAMADFVANDSKVDPAAFQRVATGAVVRHFSYEALAWAPAPSDKRPVGIALIEPATAHPGLTVGTELSAQGDLAAKLAASRHSGEAIALPLAPADNGRRVWVFVPAPGSTGEQGIQGFFGASLRLDRMIDRAVAEFGPEGVTVELREASANGRAFFRMPASAAGGPFVSLHGQRPLIIADRSFVLAPAVSKTALIGHQSLEVWVVLLAGMLFVGLLEGVLLVAAGRPRQEELFELPLHRVPLDGNAGRASVGRHR